MNGLFAEGFSVGHMVMMGLVGAAVAIAVAFGRIYRAGRDQANRSPSGEGAKSTLSLVGVIVLCLALIFGGVIIYNLTK